MSAFLADVIYAAGRRWRGTRAFCHGCGRHSYAAFYVAALLLGLAVAPTAGHADPRSELAQARHDLAISEQYLARMTERVEVVRSDPSMEPEQRQRLDEYVARVRELVALNRERVRNLDQAVGAAPAGTASAGSGGGKPSVAATHAEEVAALETRLGGSLAEFDQLLLEEARRTRTRGAIGGSGLPGGSGGGAAGETPSKRSGAGSKSPGAADPGNGKAAPQRSAGDPGSPGGRIEGGDPGTTGATAARPPDVGDGSDDDIVARQIRKAAESEPDPELREKLWNEYRKYKQGGKG